MSKNLGRYRVSVLAPSSVRLLESRKKIGQALENEMLIIRHRLFGRFSKKKLLVTFTEYLVPH